MTELSDETEEWLSCDDADNETEEEYVFLIGVGRLVVFYSCSSTFMVL